MIHAQRTIPVTVSFTQLREKPSGIARIGDGIERIFHGGKSGWVVSEADLEASDVNVEWRRRPDTLQACQRLGLRLVDLADAIDIGRPRPMVAFDGGDCHQYTGRQSKRDLGVVRRFVTGDLVIIRRPGRPAPAKSQSDAEAGSPNV
jgi:hypothetical protein